jgi:hypothetical protein
MQFKLPIFQGWCHFVPARAYNFWRYRAHRLGIVGAYMGYKSLNIPMEYWPNAHWGSLLTFEIGADSNCPHINKHVQIKTLTNYGICVIRLSHRLHVLSSLYKL